MVIDRFNPPPAPSTPKDAPWEDMQKLIQRIDKLISLMEGPAVAAPTIVTIPGAPGSAAQLVYLMQEMVPESIGTSAVISFQKEVATAYQDEQDRQVPFDGIVKYVIMGFPAGCQQLLEVNLAYYPSTGSRKLIIPTIENSFIALDDFSVLFEPRFPIKRPGNLRVEWWNYDSLNTHTVPVVVTVVPTNLEVGG